MKKENKFNKKVKWGIGFVIAGFGMPLIMGGSLNPMNPEGLMYTLIILVGAYLWYKGFKETKK